MENILMVVIEEQNAGHTPIAHATPTSPTHQFLYPIGWQNCQRIRLS